MSYFPCDEGLYKKKYCNEKDKELLTGIEYVIDEVLPNWYDNNAYDDLEYDLDEIEVEEDLKLKLEDLADGTIETIELSSDDLLDLIKAVQNATFDDIEHWVEVDRGEMLVSCVDAEHGGKEEKELVPLWNQSEADEYPTKMTDELKEHYVFNANGKLRPRWNENE